MVQTLWAITTEERKSWYWTLLVLYYVNFFLTYNWEETVQINSFSAAVTSVLHPQVPPVQQKPKTTLLYYSSLPFHEPHTTQQELPKPQPHLINLSQAPGWDSAPCDCCFRMIRWGALSHLSCMKTPIFREKGQERQVRTSVYFAHSQQHKIPVRFTLVADELLQPLKLHT